MDRPWLAEDQRVGLEEGRSLAGRGPDVLETTRDVVELEESVDRTPARDTSIVAWLFHREEAPRQIELAELPDLVTDDANFAWVDLSDYTQDDLHHIARLLDLHPRAIHTALSRWQRPRLDVFGEQYLVTATIAQLDTESYRVQAGEIDLFVGRNFLLSTHKFAVPLSQWIMARAQQHPILMERDSAYLLYIILDELLEYYETLEEKMQDDVERMEERALVADSDDFLEDLLQFKRYAFALGQLVEQHREVFAAFLRPDFPFVGGDEMPIYFRDLDDRLSRLLSDLAASRDAINGAFDIYVSQVAHRTNHIIKVLTVVSTILLPTSVILGFFGTAFQGVPLYTQGGFLIMVCVILAVTMSILFTFHRSGWL